MTARLFDWFDYTVFAVMLLLSALIGVYFAFFAKQKQNTTSEYLLGGKKMGVFPMSMSLIASQVSSIFLLGIPAEMYVFGSQYCVISLSRLLVGYTVVLVYLPVFYSLQLTSCYEYLKLRFSESVHFLGSIFFIIEMMLYIPLVIYATALACSQVTGVNLHFVTPILCCVGVFYTSMGGLKAVVWTDTLQTLLMFGICVVIVLLGLHHTGNILTVYERNQRGERLELFNMDLDPTARHTFWNVLLGGFFHYLSVLTASQAVAQRYLAMPSAEIASKYVLLVKRTILVFTVGLFTLTSVLYSIGFMAFAYFEKCDPISTETVQRSDQILPHFMMEICESFPGLPGLFVAGVFTGTFSSMSSGLNSMTGVIFQDLVRPVLKRPLSEGRSSLYMQLTTAVLGVLCTALVLVVQHVGVTLIQVVQSLLSVSAGPLLGLFTLGVLFPWANSKGAFAGAASSFLVVAWMSLGAHIHVAKRRIIFRNKPLSLEGCTTDLLNITIASQTSQRFDPGVFFFYKVSYMWYTTLGLIITLVVGMAVSYMTGMNDVRDVDREMLSPVIHRFLPPRPPDSPKELVALSANHEETTADHAHNQRFEKERNGITCQRNSEDGTGCRNTPKM